MNDRQELNTEQVIWCQCLEPIFETRYWGNGFPVEVCTICGGDQ